MHIVSVFIAGFGAIPELWGEGVQEAGAVFQLLWAIWVFSHWYRHGVSSHINQLSHFEPHGAQAGRHARWLVRDGFPATASEDSRASQSPGVA